MCLDHHFVEKKICIVSEWNAWPLSIENSLFSSRQMALSFIMNLKQMLSKSEADNYQIDWLKIFFSKTDFYFCK